ncbi:MAG: hypothetical protein MRZ79_03550 [Bacteroidia bacterium]|nr:hypothetical protein [Bacteroidia bacterium]
MGKRTKRYLHHQLEEHLNRFDQQEIQLIQWDGTTFSGLARVDKKGGIEIIDKNSAWYNRKKHSHFVEMSQIREVVIDEISSW